MPMFISLGSQCCMNCKHCEYDEDFGYHCPKASTRIGNPLMWCCERYMSMSSGKKKSTNTKKEDKSNMIVSPFKEVSVPKTVFNEDYWKVGDAYVISTPNTEPKFYVLAEVVETSHVRMDGGVTIGIEEFDNGSYRLINHISLDYACSKPVSGE